MVLFILKNPKREEWAREMPGVFARAYPNSSIPEDVVGKTFTYAWEDSWIDVIEVKKINRKEAAEIMKRSVGFYGYDWMINSILKHRKIVERRSV